MSTASKNGWRVWSTALAVFALGVIAGMLVTNLYYVRRAPGSRGWYHVPGYRTLADRLDLKGDQATRVEAVLEDARQQLTAMRAESEPKVKEIRSQTEDRLKELLTEDQWQRYVALKSEMRERRHGGKRSRSDGTMTPSQPASNDR
jgi:sRNA-binding protein